MLLLEYVRRYGMFYVSSVSCGAFSLSMAHSVCDNNDTDAPVSISIVIGVLKTLIMHTYGFAVPLLCMLAFYKGYVSLHRSASVRLSGCSLLS